MTIELEDFSIPSPATFSERYPRAWLALFRHARAGPLSEIEWSLHWIYRCIVGSEITHHGFWRTG